MSSHLGGWIPSGDANTYMPDVWETMVHWYGVTSVVDIGCGSGHNLQWFKENGLHCVGVDGDPKSVDATIGKGLFAILNDYTKTSALIHDYDLAICTEFAEHVEAQYEYLWLEDLARCKYVLFTHALPNQGGYHHVNEQLQDYWLERFALYGFTPDWDFTNKYRNESYAWGRNTLTLFKRVV
jgi:SAM-dependent methyltransferase